MTTAPFTPRPPSGDKALPEPENPYDLPMPGQWPPARPECVIVVDELRGWRPGPPSLAELLDTGPARTRDPEPDLEAEP